MERKSQAKNGKSSESKGASSKRAANGGEKKTKSASKK